MQQQQPMQQHSAGVAGQEPPEKHGLGAAGSARVQWLAARALLALLASLTALLLGLAALPPLRALRAQQPDAAALTGLSRLRPAWDHKCDKHLAARSSDAGREVEARLCVDHAALRNAARSVINQSLAFVAIGDWGRDGFCCQRDVALEMSRAAQQTSARPLWSTRATASTRWGWTRARTRRCAPRGATCTSRSPACARCRGSRCWVTTSTTRGPRPC
jgi:hypothetical protein